MSVQGRVGHDLERELLAGGQLTEREREVLEGAALGETARETGDRLYLGAETVRAHRKHALYKLGARSLTRAVVLAISVGALNLESLVDEDC